MESKLANHLVTMLSSMKYIKIKVSKSLLLCERTDVRRLSRDDIISGQKRDQSSVRPREGHQDQDQDHWGHLGLIQFPQKG